jgi:hypothetical protein
VRRERSPVGEVDAHELEGRPNAAPARRVRAPARAPHADEGIVPGAGVCGRRVAAIDGRRVAAEPPSAEASARERERAGDVAVSEQASERCAARGLGARGRGEREGAEEKE